MTTAYVRGLRDVSLQLLPPVVERGNSVELLCRYDLQGDPLYTIKFYRGTYEFYRYTPNDHPPIKTFLFKGLDVDLSSSQGRPSSVVVQNVGYNLAGNVSCEVSTDTSFSTMMSTKYLTVVELPKKPPDIHIDSSPRSGGVWEAGDILNATCTSAPARPTPSLFWFINDEPCLSVSLRSPLPTIRFQLSFGLITSNSPLNLRGQK
ncbi:uncharacterized protein LOC128989072 [Macrosteles quadrilineatus]|uniref:uncharacterized protein LOC128989072 n=1 Tax=Macrosteles quadrilineatus TaxID=74068 RepID=UPI0023E0CB9E|nr:uncharacterized protein LOC128989072 [Macrosteles quadrilineatus]